MLAVHELGKPVLLMLTRCCSLHWLSSDLDGDIAELLIFIWFRFQFAEVITDDLP